jgi:hypothetical protein
MGIAGTSALGEAFRVGDAERQRPTFVARSFAPFQEKGVLSVRRDHGAGRTAQPVRNRRDDQKRERPILDGRGCAPYVWQLRETVLQEARDGKVPGHVHERS